MTHCHANMYLPADGDMEVLQEVLDGMYPYLLLTPVRVVVLTGDLNAPYLALAPAPLCDLSLSTLSRLGLCRRGPLAEAPTWLSPQGFLGALDHIFLRSPSEGAHSTEVRSDSSFPSDHPPVVTTLHGLPPAPQPICPSKRGRFPIPRKPLDNQLRTLNDTFRAAVLQPPPDAGDIPPRYATVTAALYAAATAASGHPTPSQPVAAAVRVRVLDLQIYTTQHPDWASYSLHLMQVARLKGHIRAAWDPSFSKRMWGWRHCPVPLDSPPKLTTAER